MIFFLYHYFRYGVHQASRSGSSLMYSSGFVDYRVQQFDSRISENDNITNSKYPNYKIKTSKDLALSDEETAHLYRESSK